MKLEDWKNSIPDTPVFIHEMIQNEVRNQLKEQPPKEFRRKSAKWSAMRVAAAVAICVLSTTTIAYAGVKLYHMLLERKGDYSVDIHVNPENNAVKNIPQEIPEIDIVSNYIPDGMEWEDESHLVYSDKPNMGGFTFQPVYLDYGGLGAVTTDKNVIEHEERNFGKYEGIYLNYHSPVQSSWFNQRIYLLCPEIDRIMIIYILSDVPKEDAIKVAENLVITESDKLVDSQYVDMWSQIAREDNTPYSAKLNNRIEEDQLTIHSIGDSFNITGVGYDDNDNYFHSNEIAFSVDSVQVRDDLQLLNPDLIPEEWNDTTDSNGKLVNNTLSYIKTGNGVDTLDEVVKTESVKQKLVYVTTTYTNMSDQKINHLTYLVTLVTMNNENNIYQIYTSKEQSGDGYDFILGDSVARTGEMGYIDTIDVSTHGRNSIPVLNPGESVQVNLAWIVNETDLNHMYLSPHADGASVEFSEDMLEKGIVDIRQ